MDIEVTLSGCVLWVCVCVCGCVCKHNKTKTPDQNDSILATLVILDPLSKPIDFGFKTSRVGGTG